MEEYDRKVLDLLTEIRDLLEPISNINKEQFLQDKIHLLKSVITPGNKKILPLLLDPRNLTQERIAAEAGVSQATVSRFITEIRNKNLFSEEKDNNFNTRYIDKWNLLGLLEGKVE